jgi:hypothetical protein
MNKIKLLLEIIRDFIQNLYEPDKYKPYEAEHILGTQIRKETDDEWFN